MKALFYGPTKEQYEELRRRELVETKYCEYLHSGEHSIEQAKAKYEELKREFGL